MWYDEGETFASPVDACATCTCKVSIIITTHTFLFINSPPLPSTYQNVSIFNLLIHPYRTHTHVYTHRPILNCAASSNLSVLCRCIQTTSHISLFFLSFSLSLSLSLYLSIYLYIYRSFSFNLSLSLSLSLSYAHAYTHRYNISHTHANTHAHTTLQSNPM